MATDPDARLRVKLTTLLGRLQELRLDYRLKEDAILHEVEALLGGQPGIGAILKHAEAHFSTLWAVRYPPGPYVFHYAKDRPILKQRLAALGLEEVEGRMCDYLQRHTDDLLIKARHPFSLFLSTINRYQALRSAEDMACQHEPRCPNTSAHWRLHQAEKDGDAEAVAMYRRWNG